ncbi:MAG: M23 family metallopeptidase [Arenimonas sp.]|nr:M23 family metallopeptidase [Arenimonas sp.]
MSHAITLKPKHVFSSVFLALTWFICAPASSQTALILNRQSLENAVSIEIKNFGPVQVQLSDNKSNEVLFESVLNGPGVFTVSDLPSKSINHLALESFLGQPVKQQAFMYQIPFSQYANWTISQGFHGASSHGNILNEYAVDFDIPFGTPVIAARTGIVMEVIDAFPDNGKQSKSKLEHANSIRILHEDGSMAVYGHLLQDSALVKPGQWLVSGTVLAQSGNSGFTNGSHLHFVVQINTGMQLASIPFQMKSNNGIMQLGE